MSSRRGDRIMAVLRVRKLQEEQARGEALALANEAHLADAVARREQERLDALGSPDTDAASWTGTRAGLLAQASHVAATTRAGQAATGRADEAREAWLVRHERVSLLERLADAHRSSTARALLAARQAASDDITNARWGREKQS